MQKIEIKMNNKNDYIKSPFNYSGGKFKLLNQILPLIPPKGERFIDLFCGGCNVGININGFDNILFNDINTYLIDCYREFDIKVFDSVLKHINNRISLFGLSKTNKEGYYKFKDYYNQEKNPLDLYVLCAYCFNHIMTFNSKHEFNQTFGKNRSHFNPNMEKNLKRFLEKLKNGNFSFSSVSFENFNFESLTVKDFVYLDPPYLIADSGYNRGSKNAGILRAWTKEDEIRLLDLLDVLNSRGISFGLSNVLEHKGLSNSLLKDWINKNNYNYKILDYNYSNCHYGYKYKDDKRKKSIEVFVYNYKLNEDDNYEK